MAKKNKEIKIKSQYRAIARMTNRQRKLRIFTLYSLVVIAVLLISVVLSLAVLFKIETIQVEGCQMYEDDTIVQYSGINKYQNIYLCKQDKVSENLCNKFPYIESVRLEKQIPNKIIIHVTQAKETATIQHGEDYITLNSSNKVLDISKSPKENIAVINGIQIQNAEICKEVVFEDANKANILQQLQIAVAKYNISDVTLFDISDIYDSFFVYKGRLNIKLGQPDNIEQKVEFAAKIISSSTEVANSKGNLDVSMCTSDNKVYFTPDYI